MAIASTYGCLCMSQQCEGGVGNIDAVRGEGDNVRPPVPGHVGYKARIGVLARPPAGGGAGAEIAEIEYRRLEGAVAVAERSVDAVRGEGDDIGAAITVHIG